MSDLTEKAAFVAFWFLMSLSVLCIGLLIFLVGDAIINGVYVAPACEVKP